MEWLFCNSLGEPIQNQEVGSDFQVDNVGNILQRRGGINPKACQKCKKEFTGRIEEKPTIHKRSIYACKDCDFKNTSSEASFDHKIETDHKIKKDYADVVTNIQRFSIGTIPMITKTDNDILIICSECKNGNN